MLLYLWAGVTHAWTLFTIVCFFYFPVFLDTRATHRPGVLVVPELGIILTLLLGPVLYVLRQRVLREWFEKRFPRFLSAPILSNFLCLYLGAVFVGWRAAGRVVWDAGSNRAGFFYLLYWVSAGLAAFSLSLRGGMARFSGCAQVFERLHHNPSAQKAPAIRSLYRYSRHPIETYLIVSLWMTPLMTWDRLLWATSISCYALVSAELSERSFHRSYGNVYEDYASQVPKWFPLFLKSYTGGK